MNLCFLIIQSFQIIKLNTNYVDTYMINRVLERGEDITVKGLLKYPIQKNNITEYGKDHLLDIANEKLVH